MMKTFQQLVASGDSEAQFIQGVMESQDYRSMNNTVHSQNAREIVTSYFRRTFGTGDADGMRQNNTVSRGTWEEE